MGKKRRGSVKPEPESSVFTDETKKRVYYIIGLSILMKIVLIFLTTFVLQSFIDTFGIMYYYEHVGYLVQGQIPYIGFDYEYPIFVFIPSLIALIPALLFNNPSFFVLTFSGLMILCDSITAVCVYLIAKKIWDNDDRAWYAAILYVTAISAMYFSLVEYSPFASCVLMASLVGVVYGKQLLHERGWLVYFGLISGFFIKIYPALALPFVAFYNAHTTSLKQEIITASKVIIPAIAILFVPFVILNPKSLSTYIPARLDIGFFPNTIIWTAQVWLHDVFGLGVTKDAVLVVIYICMAIGMAALLYAGYKYPEKDAKVMLKLILGAIILIVMSFKVRSPQYIIWFTPFLAILVVDNIKKMALFYIVQLLAFIEFPLTFWKLWTNVEYTSPFMSPNWQLTLVFFTIEFATLLVLVWWTIDPKSIYRTLKG